MEPPASVLNAMKDYTPPPNATIKPPASGEKSLIFKWGIRLEYAFEGVKHIGWICFADAKCRSESKFIALSCGKIYIYSHTHIYNMFTYR